MFALHLNRSVCSQEKELLQEVMGGEEFDEEDNPLDALGGTGAAEGPGDSGAPGPDWDSDDGDQGERTRGRVGVAM